MSDAIGWPTAEYDGIADFYARNMEDFFKAFSDPFDSEVAFVDEKNFVDHSAAHITLGREFVVVEDGKTVETHTTVFN